MSLLHRRHLPRLPPVPTGRQSPFHLTTMTTAVAAMDASRVQRRLLLATLLLLNTRGHVHPLRQLATTFRPPCPRELRDRKVLLRPQLPQDPHNRSYVCAALGVQPVHEQPSQ